jgi:glycosyltransferase involved in cell wall biosynthesis
MHTIPSLGEWTGGPARSVSALCKHISHFNVDVHLLRGTLHDNDIALAPIVHSGLWPGDLTALSNSSYKSKNIIAHVHTLWTPFSHRVCTHCYRRGFKYVLSPRGMLTPWALKHKAFKKFIAYNLYQKQDIQRAAALHATAFSEAEDLRKLGFKQPIAVIPNGVELPELPSAADNGEWIRGIGDRKTDKGELIKDKETPPLSNEPASDSSLSLFQRPKTALFLSRINPKKGLPMLLDVWAKLRPEGWELVIAGNDDANHLPEVHAKIREHGLQDVVKVIGPLFEAAKARAFQSADFFVLPSYSENFGIVVTEALAYQVPVLTTTGCPWVELNTHNCGWWVEPTHDGIEKGLRAALAPSQEERAAMGARGRRLVEENYLWPAIAEKMLRFYGWLLHGGAKPEFVV